MRAKKILRDERNKPTSSRIPTIPVEIVEWLEATYPDRCPPPDTTRDEFLALASRVELVRTLRTHYERQQTKK